MPPLRTPARAILPASAGDLNWNRDGAAKPLPPFIPERGYIMLIPMVGMRFRPPALAVLANLPSGTPLQMVREPDNQYDSNAIKVVLPEGWKDELSDPIKDEMSEMCKAAGHPMPGREEFHLGYIPAEVAKNMAPGFDQNGVQMVVCKLGSNAEGKYCVDDGAVDEEVIDPPPFDPND